MARRFGMRLDGWMAPSRCVELAVAAEKAGFDAIWFAENPYGRGVIPAVAACMLATKTIEVGIGVFNPFNRHPTLIAMEMGALDELSNGRSNLGLGAGVQKILAKARISSDKPIAAMRDAINIVRQLMTGQSVTYEGKIFSALDIKLEFEPLRKNYPIVMAAMGDQALRLSGEIADGVMISNLCTTGFTKRAIEIISSSADKRTLPAPPRIIQYAPCVAKTDRKAARDFAKQVVGGMIMRSFGHEGTPQSRQWHLIGSDLPESHFEGIQQRLAAGENGADVVSDTVLDLYAVAGDANDCLKAYQRYFDAGVDEVVVTFRGPDPLEEMSYLSDALRGLKAG